MKPIYLLLITMTLLVSCTKTVDPNETNTAPATITLWKDAVIGAIYNKSTNKVAFGRADSKGYYHIYTSNADGSNEQQLTWTSWKSDRHQWPEEWDASGQYLFCYVEKNLYVSESGHTRTAEDAIPGYGGYTDIWMIKADGSQAWQLTDLPNNYNNGIIHGAISADGSKFAWTQRTLAPVFLDLNLGAGAYIFTLADITYGTQPSFSNIKSYKPGNIDAGGEVESISSDKKNMLVYSSFETKNMLGTPIYKIDLETKITTKLTTESFSQTPTYTPDGKYIIYMTGKDNDIFPLQVQGADWWIMNADGSNKRRLTYMNIKDHAQSDNRYKLAGSLSFLSDTTFLGGVMTEPLGLLGKTVKVNFAAFVK